MYCKYCGSKNSKNSKFCASCGKEIGEENSKEEKIVAPTTNMVKGSFFQDNKAIIIVAVIIAIVLFILGNDGSGSGKNNPESVSKQFLDGIKACDTNKVFKNMYSEEKDISEFTTKQKKAFMSNVCGIVDSYQILDSSIDGDEAEVKIRITGQGDTEKGTFYLVKINGKWLVDMDKTF